MASPDLCSHHRFSITIVPASYATENQSGAPECQKIWWGQAYKLKTFLPPDWKTSLAKFKGTSSQVPICSDGPLDQRQLPEATDEIQGSLINRQNCSHDAARQKSSYGHTVLRYIKGIVINFQMNNFQRGLLSLWNRTEATDEIQESLIVQQSELQSWCKNHLDND